MSAKAEILSASHKIGRTGRKQLMKAVKCPCGHVNELYWSSWRGREKAQCKGCGNWIWSSDLSVTSAMGQRDLKVAVKRILKRSKLDANGCLVWLGRKDSGGYGQICVSGKMQLVHRIMHTVFNGDPGDFDICHYCDVTACVNPRHLFAGNHSDNMGDMVAKGRSCRGEAKPNAIVKTEDVIEMRDRFVPWCPINGAAALGREFGITAGAASNIVHRRKWEHVP